jgi:hypothetical protein
MHSSHVPVRLTPPGQRSYIGFNNKNQNEEASGIVIALTCRR